MKQFNQWILISGVVIQICFSSMTVNAANADKNNSNKSLLSQFQEIYNSLQVSINNYQKEFTKAVGKLEAELNQAIQSSVGDLGVPDPLKAGKNCYQECERRSKFHISYPNSFG